MVGVSRRKERNAAHLHGAISRVSDTLASAPQLLGGVHLTLSGGGDGVGGRESPQSPDTCRSGATSRKQVRKQSLRFPRVSLGGDCGPLRAVDDESLCGNLSRTGTTVPPSSQGTASTDPSSFDASEQIEDLRLQNAVLKRSLAMLQQSVVDSMKGNRGQFQGNGIFKAKNAQPAEPLGQPQCPETAEEIEALQAALSERRQAVRDALSQRDDAVLEAACLRREMAELQEKADAMSERLRLVEAAAELHATEEAHSRQCQDAVSQRAACLETEAQRATAEADGLRAALCEEKARCSEMAAAASAAEGLLADTASVRQASADAASEALQESQSLRSANASLAASLQAQQAACDADRAAHAEELRRLARNQNDLATKAVLQLSAEHSCHRGLICAYIFHAWASVQRKSKVDGLRTRVENAEKQARALNEDSDTLRLGESLSAQALQASSAEATRLQRRLEEMEAEAARLAETVRGGDFRVAASEEKAARCEAELERVLALLRDSENSCEELRREAAEANCRAEAAAADDDSRHSKLISERDKADLLARETAESLSIAEERLAKACEEALAAKASNGKADKSVDDAFRRLGEAEASQKLSESELARLRSEFGMVTAEANLLRQRIEVAEAKASAAQHRADVCAERAAGLERKEQSRSDELEGSRRENASLQRDLSAMKSSLEDARQAGGREDALSREAADLRMSLAEAKSDARAASDRLRIAKEEAATATRQVSEERDARSTAGELAKEHESFRDAARQAIEAARHNVRFLVTAPKVSINVGGNDVNVHVPFPFEEIKQSVREQIIPQYSKVTAVGESLGDKEIQANVQAMVERLAVSLQTRICELMPQAEGTCNWDGFGAKCGALGGAR